MAHKMFFKADLSQLTSGKQSYEYFFLKMDDHLHKKKVPEMNARSWWGTVLCNSKFLHIMKTILLGVK